MIRHMGRIIIHAFFWGALTILRWLLAGVGAAALGLVRFAKRFDS